MTFKQTIITFIFAQFLSAVIVVNVCAQVTVKGHITAEVIESAHASSTVVTSSVVQNEQVNTESGTLQNTDVLNLGAVTIHTGLNTACDIKLNEATLSDCNGNIFTIKPASITSGRSDTVRADGSHTLLLNGIASLTHGLASGLYRGSYTVVVLYN